MIRYLKENKQWIFSGIGIFILGLLLSGAAYIWKYYGGTAEKTVPRNLNIRAWNGHWAQSFTSKQGILKGIMEIQVNKTGLVKGCYSYSTDKDKIRGTLEGTLSDDASAINGKWSNEIGQGGRFFFRLDEYRASFDGKYSMAEARPVARSENAWYGTKLGN